MPTYNEEKKRLLIELKVETLNQLSAVENENVEEFLLSTEKCSSIMEAIDALQLEKTQLSVGIATESEVILKEITAIRDRISILLKPLYEQIKEKANSEKQMNFVKRRYNQGDQPVPSIFLDKRI